MSLSKYSPTSSHSLPHWFTLPVHAPNHEFYFIGFSPSCALNILCTYF